MTVSTASILIRWAQADLPSLTIAAWRLALASLILAPVTVATRWRELRQLTRAEWKSLIVSGILLALHFGTWITSLAYTTVLASVTLVTTASIFVGLISHLFLQERLSRMMGVSILIVTVGGGLIGLEDLGQGTHRLWGDVLALIGAITLAGYMVIGRRLRARLSILTYVFPVYGTAALLLMATVLVWGLPIQPPSSQSWLWLLLMALGPQILGHSSLNWALGYLSATYVTIAVLGEPILSTLLAWWLLDETPSLWAVLGGLLILLGIALASREERRGRRSGLEG
jgi:drug/metabolite transporter (DMT)-like permease